MADNVQSDVPGDVAMHEHIDRIIQRLADGKSRLIIEHPEPSIGSMVCSPSVAIEVAQRLADRASNAGRDAVLEEAAKVAEAHADDWRRLMADCDAVTSGLKTDLISQTARMNITSCEVVVRRIRALSSSSTGEREDG